MTIAGGGVTYSIALLSLLGYSWGSWTVSRPMRTGRGRRSVTR